MRGISSVTFTANELKQNISKTFANDRLVALRGYVPAHWNPPGRVRDKSIQSATEFRERRPYQGGKQVVHDLKSPIFENPARPKGQQGSSFPGSRFIFPARLLRLLSHPSKQTDRTILIKPQTWAIKAPPPAATDDGAESVTNTLKSLSGDPCKLATGHQRGTLQASVKRAIKR